MTATGVTLPTVIRPRMPQALQAPSQAVVRTQNLQTTWKGLLFWLVAAVIAILGYAWSCSGCKPVGVASGALLLSAASASVGILLRLGFLFGIPRSLQHEGNGAPAPAGSAPRPARLRVNTNLEQISDWLTKILVGVGLTQLRDLGPRLWAMASTASRVAMALSRALMQSIALALHLDDLGLMIQQNRLT